MIGIGGIVVALCLLMVVVFYQQWRQVVQINKQLTDIARSLRIIAKAPKDFEEGQVIKEITAKYKSPYD